MASADETYRKEFRDRVLALEPRSILEVGCGSGGFLSTLHGWTGRLVGIDPDVDRIAALRDQGYNARVGTAEDLAFDDAEFDVVVSAYTAHHLAAWPVALKEALRVARHAHCIVDVWYDGTLPSQRVGADFSAWSKEIDRSHGMVHEDYLPLGKLIGSIANDPHYAINSIHRLVHEPANLGELEAYGRKQLATLKDPSSHSDRLNTILDEAKRVGITYEGSVMVTISRTDEARSGDTTWRRP
jgi:SAM-dependent methyltransferase